jgi:hypothetical protein
MEHRPCEDRLVACSRKNYLLAGARWSIVEMGRVRRGGLGGRAAASGSALVAVACRESVENQIS